MVYAQIVPDPVDASLMPGIDPIPAYVRERVGKMLQGKYRLNALLGVGGMAAVYAATHRNGKRLAIKMLHPELSVIPELRGRFLAEGYVANRVNHLGAVAVLDDEIADDGSVFLVMELLEGETLGARARRRGGRLDPAEVLALADQLLDVLAAAHGNQIVHRDITPENIFITTSGVVKVLDFGIARANRASMTEHATARGVAMGTPAFLAPEQARGRWESVDALTDLWAVGATMFSLLAGRAVHCAETMSELLLAAMTQPAPPIASVVAVPPEVAAIVDRALSYEKSRRFPDARAMQLAVRDAARMLGPIPLTLGMAVAPASTSIAMGAPEGQIAPLQQHHGTGVGISVNATRECPRRLSAARALAVSVAVAAPLTALLVGGALWLRSSEEAAAALTEPGPAAAASGAPERSGAGESARPALAATTEVSNAAGTAAAPPVVPGSPRGAQSVAATSTSAAPVAPRRAKPLPPRVDGAPSSRVPSPARTSRTWKPRSDASPAFLDRQH